MPADSMPYEGGAMPQTFNGGPRFPGSQVIRPQAGQTFPRNATFRPTSPTRQGGAQGATPWGAGITPYSATNNLIGQQIGPGESAGTQRATTAATNAQTALSNFNFTPYTQTAPANYTQSQNLLTGANNTYGGASLNYGAGNTARNAAGTALAGGRAAAETGLNNAGMVGYGSFTGGGGSGGAAARADTTALNAGLDQSNAFVGDKYGDAADTQRARALTLQGLEKSMSGPDRGALGSEYLKLYEERSQPGFDASLRTVNQRNAAMGRRGSGMVTSELSDVTATRERDLAQQRRQLAADAAGLTLQDNLARTNAGLGVTQGFGSEDRAGAGVRLSQAGQLASNANSRFNAEATNAGFQDAAYGRMEQAAGRNAAGAQAYASMQRGIAGDRYGMAADDAARYERNAGAYDTQENNRLGLMGDQANFTRGVAGDLAGFETTSYGQRNQQAQQARDDEYNLFGATRNRASDLTDYQNNERSYDFNNRNELRNERGYQAGRADRATDDQVRQVELDDRLTNSSFDRDYRRYSAGTGVPIPGTSYTQSADRYQNQANGINQLTGEVASYIPYTYRRSGPGNGTQER